MPQAQATLDVRFNPDLDVSAARDAFARTGRARIDNVLEDASAHRLHAVLDGAVPWALAVNDGDEHAEYALADLNALTPRQKTQFNRAVWSRARTRFQYMFYQVAISEAVRKGWNAGHPLLDVNALVNSATALDLARTVTGEGGVRLADAIASCYLAGHFLARHDDIHHRHDRVAAYVLGLTPDWSSDWGGLLQFFDDTGRIVDGFTPGFNTLTLFSVPQAHAVSLVAPWAGGKRLSITGWFRRS